MHFNPIYSTLTMVILRTALSKFRNPEAVIATGIVNLDSSGLVFTTPPWEPNGEDFGFLLGRCNASPVHGYQTGENLVVLFLRARVIGGEDEVPMACE